MATATSTDVSRSYARSRASSDSRWRTERMPAKSLTYPTGSGYAAAERSSRSASRIVAWSERTLIMRRGCNAVGEEARNGAGAEKDNKNGARVNVWRYSSLGHASPWRGAARWMAAFSSPPSRRIIAESWK